MEKSRTGAPALKKFYVMNMAEAMLQLGSMNFSEKGLRLKRKFTKENTNPFDEISWEQRDAVIKNEHGEIVFEQRGVEVPADWSQNATNIVVSKYFRGKLGAPERENSAKQMIDRVVKTIGSWGRAGGYFADEESAKIFEGELAYMLVNQMFSFNSPVWFNVGIDAQPQTSACQPYRAMVSTPQGLIPIGEITNKIMLGLEVFDSNGTTKVIAVKNNGKKKTFRINLANGTFIEATGDHLVKAVNERRTKPFWITVCELNVGMKMHLYPHTISAGVYYVNPSEAALAGWLQTDGFVGQYKHGTNRSLTLEFETVNDEEFGWVMSHIKNVFGDSHYNIRDVKTQDKELKYRRIRFYGKKFQDFVDRYDLLKRGSDIRVPKILFAANLDAVIAYLKSAFQAEGYISIRENSSIASMATISRGFIQDCQLLLYRLGIYSRINRKIERRVDRKDLWTLDVGIGSERKMFSDRVGFISYKKTNKLSTGLQLENLKICPHLREETIVSIEEIGDEEVFDIQTESGEYLTNNVCVHNCFILDIKDTMQDILRWYATEGMIFKFGSGSGINISPLRGSKEFLAGGGNSSGPVAYMKAADVSAGTIKSGGKTRRAAKMVILNAEHPDIVEFINCKASEEKKAWALIDAGYDGGFNVPGGAYDSVFFQNANHSVRATDEFMKAVERDDSWQTKFVKSGAPAETYKAREILKMIAEAVWVCGDPGMQFDSNVNMWHTCKASGRINGSNPCVTGDTLISTSEGYKRIRDLVGGAVTIIDGVGRESLVTNVFPTGQKEIYELKTKSGFNLKLTADHKIFTANRGDVALKDLTEKDFVMLQTPGFGSEQIPIEMAEVLGAAIGDGCIAVGRKEQRMLFITLAPEESAIAERLNSVINAYKISVAIDGRGARQTEVASTETTSRFGTSASPVIKMLEEYAVLDKGSHMKSFRDRFFSLDKKTQASAIRGLFTTDGTVANYSDKSQYISLDSTSIELLRQVQLILLGFGIKAKIYENRRAGKTSSLLPDGKGGMKEYSTKEIHSLRISRGGRILFEKEIGFMPESKKSKQLSEMNNEISTYSDSLIDKIKSIKFVGIENVYDLTEPNTNHFVANGIVAHNCSEYMFLDNTSCNLASINLMKFKNSENGIDIERSEHAVDLIITAMEILVTNSSYPTEEITKNSRDFRPLGLGYANLGALLMSRGLAYDSDDGRNFSAAITSLLCGRAYLQSSLLAKTVGPFNSYRENEKSFLEVIGMHEESARKISQNGVPENLLAEAKNVWDSALEHGRNFGFRNSQSTVLAPTGTIGFMMDCDTTGVEPDIALVKYKRLVGGGMMKIVNRTVPEALENLGYNEEQRKQILDYVEKNDTIEGAPFLREEDLKVFDCAFKPANGKRAIQYMGHVKMMAAVQPFLSGAISKTVNMPAEATQEEIAETYLAAWRMGLKAIAIYRDGSKRTQPLSTKLERKEFKANKRKLPDERQSITHKFNINGHEGYITVGLYEDGQPGELFIKMSKQGSTISGIMDSFALAVSMALQYGVPLKELVGKFIHTRFEPSGITDNKDIKFARSVMDYIFTWMALKYLNSEDQEEFGVKSFQKTLVGISQEKERKKDDKGFTIDLQEDSPPCFICGSIMIRSGSCYKCVNCGSTSGCS